MESVTNYNLSTRILHWLSAIIIIGMFVVGLWMVDLSYYSQWYNFAPHWHKSVGILFLFLTVFRFFWKSVTASPKVEGKPIEIVLAKIAHLVMYLLLFVVFVSGYLISTADGRGIDVFDWFTIPGAGALFNQQADIAGDIHLYSAVVLISLAALHAIAALKHHYISKDNTLRKMIGTSR
ncbi:cytochrome b [Vibrio sp. S4M6]|nr:cytochrome b [Vibrio sinus]MCL9783215.1 cytochrome b [Vibrio sinus]